MLSQRFYSRKTARTLLIGLFTITGFSYIGYLGWKYAQEKPSAKIPNLNKEGPTISVKTAVVQAQDLPVQLTSNGVVTPIRSVEVRSQITSTIRQIHFREGQMVKAGDLLFTLDDRMDVANVQKAQAQVQKTQADLDNALRNLKRQQELFAKQFITASAVEAAQNQVHLLREQVRADQAALAASQTSQSYNEIRASISGRAGAVNVQPGSLVQPSATATPLVTITQLDPIAISFTLPESERYSLQSALTQKRSVPVHPQLPPSIASSAPELTGQITFIDNTVDSTSGTIRVKAEFANPQHVLWPGSYVSLMVSPRMLTKATTIPVQAIQTGPERKFVYQIDDQQRAQPQSITVDLVQGNIAAVRGVAAGTKIVVEGGQNVKPGSKIVEAKESTLK